jgi:hypothetical protein
MEDMKQDKTIQSLQNDLDKAISNFKDLEIKLNDARNIDTENIKKISIYENYLKKKEYIKFFDKWKKDLDVLKKSRGDNLMTIDGIKNQLDIVKVYVGSIENKLNNAKNVSNSNNSVKLDSNTETSYTNKYDSLEGKDKIIADTVSMVTLDFVKKLQNKISKLDTKRLQTEISKINAEELSKNLGIYAVRVIDEVNREIT